jgi:hypothetical protein
VAVASFVNARRARRATLGLYAFGLWQLAACGGISRREVEVAAAGAGNASGRGGAGGAAGAAITGGNAGDCPLSVEFDVTFDPSGAQGPPNLCAPCAQVHFELSFSNSLPIDQVAPNCTPLCDTCEEPTCHTILTCPNELASTPYRTVWSGAYYETGTCGPGNSTTCKAAKCAAPGDYWAEFCSPFGVAAPTDDFPNACTVDTSRGTFCTIRGFTLPADGPFPVVLPLYAQ